MAEIKIEKKKTVWPWILLILVLAAVLYYFMTNDVDETDGEVQTIESTDTSALQPNTGEPTYFLT